jgi:hypothetical protein
MDYILDPSLDCEEYYTTLFTHRTQPDSLTVLPGLLLVTHTNLSYTAFSQLSAKTLFLAYAAHSYLQIRPAVAISTGKKKHRCLILMQVLPYRYTQHFA